MMISLFEIYDISEFDDFKDIEKRVEYEFCFNSKDR
jgi:hypothetical protein